MKYKVGDKVVIKSLDWYNSNKNWQGKVYVPLIFNTDMSKYCGMLATITNVEKLNEYRLDEDFFL